MGQRLTVVSWGEIGHNMDAFLQQRVHEPLRQQAQSHLRPPPAAAGQRRLIQVGAGRRLRQTLNVRPGEGRLVALLFIHSLFTGIAISLAYTASTSLFLAEFGPEKLPYIFIIAATLMIASGLLYTRLSAVIPPRSLFLGILSFLLISNLLMRGVLALSDASWLIFALLVWYRLLFTLAILQFWGLANYLFTLQQGKRLFGVIGAGEMLAQIVGYGSAALLVDAIGTANVLWLVAANLAGALFIATLILSHDRPALAEEATTLKARQSDASTLTTLTRRPYFRAILLGGMFAFLLFFVIDFGFMEVINDRYDGAASLARFLGFFYAFGFGWGFLVRVGITARALNRFGLHKTILALPLALIGLAIGIIGSGLLGLATVLFVLMLVLRQAMELLLFTVYQPAALLLYQPLKVKQRVALQTLTDTVATPVGIALAGVLLLIFEVLPGLDLVHLVALIMLLAALWALVVRASYRGYVSTLYDALARRRIVGTELDVNDAASRQVIRAKLDSEHADEVIYALNLLLELESPEALTQTIEALSQHPNADVRLTAMRQIIRLNLVSALPSVQDRLPLEPAPAVKGAILRVLCALGHPNALETTAAFLDSPDLRVRREALISLLRHGGIAGILIAGQRFLALTRSEEAQERALAASVLGHVDVHGFYQPLVDLLNDEETEVRHAALQAAGRLRADQLWPLVVNALTVEADRSVALNVLCGAGAATLPAVSTVLGQTHNKTVTHDLIRLCGQMATPAAAELLWQRLPEAPADERAAILQALGQSPFRAMQDLELQRIDEELAIEMAAAAWLVAALQDLVELHSGRLLQAALEQALDRRRTNVLWLLALAHDRATCLRVMGQIAADSSAQRAYALELLTVTVSQRQKQLIWPLMEPLSNSVRLERLASVAPQPTLDAAARLAAILEAPAKLLGPWPRACALFTIGQERLEALRPAVVATHNRVSATSPRASSEHRLLGEVAAWALDRLAIDHWRPEPENGGTPMIITVEKVIILKSIDLFSQIPDEILADVAQRLVEVELAAGTELFAKEDAGTSMYLIVSGQIRIHDGAHTLSRLKDRDVFGEMAILDPAPRMATATAETDTLLLELPQQTLYELVSTHGEVAQGIIRVLSRRLRLQSDRAQQLQEQLAQLAAREETVLT
ncbi:MAG: cyclic nucleotide-binding domain-containing protein [Candidatus Promineifilaceae bacterium]|nr:cyclic nucleotide-binding domain-containing protein [Candidatus Promineifilaceae bacterium]